MFLSRQTCPVSGKACGCVVGIGVLKVVNDRLTLPLQDQPFFGVTYKVNVTTQSQLTADPAAGVQATEEFLISQSGRLSSPASNWIGKRPNLAEYHLVVLYANRSSGWEKLPQQYRAGFSNQTTEELSQFPLDWPEIEILPLAAPAAPVTDDANYASVNIALLTPTSRGTVTISSASTDDNPVVNPNWLGTKTDQELAIQAFKRAREIGQATGIAIGDEFAPGAHVQTDAQILAYIKETLSPIHHASATCKFCSSKLCIG